MPAYAQEDCEHDWFVHTVVVDERGETQHITYYNYMCNYCMELRQEAYPEDHKWELVSKGKYQIVDADTHSCLVEQECWTCGKRKKETVKEKHLFNKFNICSICGYKKGEIIPLKPGKAANVNDKTQLKISLSKNGFITIKVKTKDGKDGTWTFCKSDGTAYKEGAHVGTDLVAVNKGTYVIKPGSEGTVSYTFAKDPAKKNYTKENAAGLKKNKKAVSVLYTKSKKKTWKRYYKIKTGKKQHVHIALKEGNMEQAEKGKSSHLKVAIYTSGMKAVKLKTESDRSGKITGYMSAKKLKKGTYYIVVSGKWNDTSKKASTGAVAELKWK